VTRYGVDPARSSIVAVVRPRMGPPTLPATVTGGVELSDELVRGLADGGAPGADTRAGAHRIEAGELVGTVEVSLDGQPPVAIDLALAAADTVAELSWNHDHDLTLVGQRTAPAGAFGIVGPPLINPSIVLSWRLVLEPPESLEPLESHEP
jgi:hypothetical protein